MARKLKPDNPLTKARRSKIGLLPEKVREVLNRNIQDGIKGNALLEWINALPEMKAIIERYDLKRINAQNITDWRNSGYRDWIETRGKYPAHNEILSKLLSIEKNLISIKAQLARQNAVIDKLVSK